MSKARPTYLSLFCGCGGFDIGFLNAGFECKGAFDIDPVAVQTHQANLKTQTSECDLSNASLRNIVQQDVDVLVAGPPCQGFSTAGKRDVNDPRNTLLLTVGEIALELNPKVVVVENVTGVIAGSHKKYWDQLHSLLRSADYHTLEIKCSAEDYGLAQTRKRIIMIGWKGTAEIQPILQSSPQKVLEDVLTGIGDVANHVTVCLPKNSRISKIAAKIKPGQKLCNVRNGERSVHTWDIPEVFGVVTEKERQVLEGLLYLRRKERVRDYGDADPVSIKRLYAHLKIPVSKLVSSLESKGYVRKKGDKYDLTHTFNGKYRRLQWDQLSPTVDTRFGDPQYFLHPEQQRGFTVREAARIQGFPDSFIFYGSQQSQYRLVGNAVPPPLSYEIARFVKRVILDSK